MFVYDKMSESFEFFEGEEKRRIKAVLNKTLNQKVVWHSIYFLFYWTWILPSGKPQRHMFMLLQA